MRPSTARSQSSLSPWSMTLALLTLVEVLAWVWTARESVTVAPPFL